MNINIDVAWFGSIILLGLVIGVIIGQLSVWRGLRKSRTIKIDNWIYQAYKKGEKNE